MLPPAKSPRRRLVLAGALGLLAVARPVAGEPPLPSEGERLARAVQMLSFPSLSKRQKAFEILGKLTLPESEGVLSEQLDQLDKGKLPLDLWLDLLEAAEKRGSPALSARLAARTAALAASADPLVPFRDCLEGGDADAGREVFTQLPQAGCVRCHSVNGEGGKIGPELAGLGLRTDRIYILESILVPDAAIVYGYAHTLLTLQNGETVSGLIHVETRDELTLISLVDGQKRRIKTAQIVSRIGLPTAMPPAFGQALTKRQIRDLVEFIVTADPG